MRRLSVLVLLAIVLAALGGLAVGFLVRGAVDGEGDTTDAARLAPFAETGDGRVDPLAWEASREEEFVERARAGFAHVLYAKSPGGAVATAARVARWRPLVDEVARDTGFAADTIEAMVFLESAGRSSARAGDDFEGAVGLTQILAETGRNLLGMRIDTERSERLTRRIGRAAERGRDDRADRLREERMRVDERFDPRKALAATGRYLTFAREELGRDDLAVVSYHMGVGNLQDALELYGEDDIPYAQLYFDSTPRKHAAAYERLASLGDDSSTYLWRVGAAQEIMRLHREDPEELGRRAALQTAKNSAEEVLHPEGTTAQFDGEDELEEGFAGGELLALDRDRLARAGLRMDANMGELARGRLDRPARLYRGLRPEALATLLYVGTAVRQLSATAPLIVTSTVRDLDYQRALLDDGNGEATRGYSLHTTGYAFDVLRRYRSRTQSRAFQFLLDRLQALDVIAWVREPAAIHVTVGPRGEELLGLLESG